MKKSLKIVGALIVIAILAAILFLYWPLYKRAVPSPENEQPIDVVLIGGGIMSMTLATYLQELEPNWKVQAFERLDAVALESSNGWNNAGTGHAGFAELNYTPEKNGVIETERAVKIAEQFEVSRQFWAYQVKNGRLSANPSDFINATPHMSFVWGDENVEFLRKRHEAITKNPLFYGMEFSTDHEQIRKWAPLVIEGRDPNQKVAATYMPIGTDVNFGVITNQLTEALKRNPNFNLALKHEVSALSQNDDKTWNVTVKDLNNNTERTVKTKFVFIGAGGASLKLLQMSGIPESQNYGGFPVGGQFLSFDDPAITSRHNAKVYGKAEVGAPPMSVPHLDTRRLDGKQTMLFGPFALFNTKFLKTGSWFDVVSSVNNHNVFGMMKVGVENTDLIEYLIEQAQLSDDDRQKELLKYYPNAKQDSWKLITAGQRVQVIKKDPEKGTVLQFGTEVVTDQNHSIAALLGASPGASTSPPIMLTVLDKSFPTQMKNGWEEKLKVIIPSYKQKLNESVALTNQIRRMTSEALKLPHIEVPANLNAPTTPKAVEAPKTKNLNVEQQAM
ncbi:MAG: malate dehydrogenase (quinone) [Acinetobacter sp.]|nr:malate dehydrogenase (quinone) [Acinetobacter sp.]